MSFDRFDPYSAGYGRLGPQRPGTPPSFAGKPPQGISANNPLDVGLPVARATSESFVKQWGQGALTYGSHSLAAEVINRAVAPGTNAGKKYQAAHQNVLQDLTKKNTTANAAQRSVGGAVSYSELLHLGNKQTPIHQLSWERFSSTVKSNLREFGKRIHPDHIKDFFAQTSTKNYLKNTVVKGNIQPIQDLATKSSNHEIGTGVLKTAAAGLLGYDVVKHTHTAYQHAKAQEDGTFKSRLHTYKETAKAFGKYGFRDGASWEFAGVGAAIGKAILPLALGPVSVGGIVIGALAGIVAEKGLDKVLHTGERDPVQPDKKHQGEDPVDEGNDGSRGGLIKR